MKFELSEYVAALNEHNSWCLLAFSAVNTKLALKRHRLQACQLINENPLFHISNNSPHPYPLKKEREKTNKFCSWNNQAKIKKRNTYSKEQVLACKGRQARFNDLEQFTDTSQIPFVNFCFFLGLGSFQAMRPCHILFILYMHLIVCLNIRAQVLSI